MKEGGQKEGGQVSTLDNAISHISSNLRLNPTPDHAAASAKEVHFHGHRYSPGAVSRVVRIDAYQLFAFRFNERWFMKAVKFPTLSLTLITLAIAWFECVPLHPSWPGTFGSTVSSAPA